ncbi:unnamed protein product [Calicophoron daubneyi]|uniref:Uncharacterized protein n=1 Tax=Calicophoron daubneyi TaxID=300641 RepID=A0AAV2TCF7_CALDB
MQYAQIHLSLFLVSIFVCEDSCDHEARFVPSDLIVYKSVDRTVHICRTTGGVLCILPGPSEWRCVAQSWNTSEEEQLMSVSFTNSLDISELAVGVYQFKCEHSVTGRWVETKKLIVENAIAYLDCAAHPQVIEQSGVVQSFRVCVKRVPIRTQWLRWMPELHYATIFPVICTGSLSASSFDNGILTVNGRGRAEAGEYWMQCDDGRFEELTYIVDRPKRLQVVPAAFVQNPHLDDEMLDLKDSSGEPIEFREYAPDAVVQCCSHVMNWLMPRWRAISGYVQFSAQGKTACTTGKLGTFQCILKDPNTYQCYSRLYIYFKKDPMNQITFEEKDRLQHHDEPLQCVQKAPPQSNLEYFVRVVFGEQLYIIHNEGEVRWDLIKWRTKRGVLRCTTVMKYMSDRPYLVDYRDFFVHIAAPTTVRFEPARGVFWRNETLECKTRGNAIFKPYMIITEHPPHFRRRLNYSQIRFDEFVVGAYEVQCYYWAPCTNKRVLTSRLYVAREPKELTVKQYWDRNGSPSMVCLDDGYPSSLLDITWTVPQGYKCCRQQGSILVTTNYSIYGNYNVVCNAIVHHPLMSVRLSKSGVFVVTMPLFVADEYLSGYLDMKIIPRIIMQTFWSVAYITLVIIIARCLRKRRPALVPINTNRKKKPVKANSVLSVDVPMEEMEPEVKDVLNELLVGFDRVQDMVSDLVQLHRSRKEEFAIKGFDWSLRKRQIVRSNTGDIMSDSHSLPTDRMESEPIALEDLHRAHSTPASTYLRSGITEVTELSDMEVLDSYPIESPLLENLPAEPDVGRLKKQQKKRRKVMASRKRRLSANTLKKQNTRRELAAKKARAIELILSSMRS